LWDLPNATKNALTNYAGRRETFYCPSVRASVKPHMVRGNPGGGNAAYVDGHTAWVKFQKMQMRYDPHDRVQWWW
jgi:prepilin-type processing-associated H-X9-DG protein